MLKSSTRQILPEDSASTRIFSGDATLRSGVQIPLRFDGYTDSEGAWQVRLRHIRAVVDYIGLKTVAGDLDVSPSYLSRCLNERERNNIPAKWMPYFEMRSPTDHLAAAPAALRGLKVEPVVELTAQQKLERLIAEQRAQLGPEIADMILSRAMGGK